MGLVKKYWFFLGMATVMSIAIFWPAAGYPVRAYKVIDIGIFLAFLVTGLTLETSRLLEQLRDYKVLLAALFSSLLLSPLLAYYLAGFLMGRWPDFVMGALIIGAAPVTIASGTVMTALALGNVPLSLFICVAANLCCIFTIPVGLNLILSLADVKIELPVLELLAGLSLKVVLPTLIGQVLRIWLRKAVAPWGKVFSIFNQCVVLLIIFNAVSSSAGKIMQAGSDLLVVLIFMIFLHGVFLSINRTMAALMRLDPPSIAAFTIHTSQKTLTISYLIWAGYFASTYPLALIPAIAYHLTQMVLDTFVAQWFRRKAEFAATQKTAPV